MYVIMDFILHINVIDQNLMIEGSRKSTLVNPKGDDPHHVIFSNRAICSTKTRHTDTISQHIIDVYLWHD